MDLPFHLEGGVFVRDAPDPPTRAVPRALLAVREDLRRGHVLVAVAERALLRGGLLARGPELFRALRPDRREDHPGVRHVILAKLGHGGPVGEMREDSGGGFFGWGGGVLVPPPPVCAERL